MKQIHPDPKEYRRRYMAEKYKDPKWRKAKLEYLAKWREKRKQEEMGWTTK